MSEKEDRQKAEEDAKTREDLLAENKELRAINLDQVRRLQSASLALANAQSFDNLQLMVAAFHAGVKDDYALLYKIRSYCERVFQIDISDTTVTNVSVAINTIGKLVANESDKAPGA